MAKRLDKPIRLYVMAIFVVIAYGLFPLVSVFPVGRESFLLVGPRFLPFNGSVQVLYGTDGEISVILLVITLALGLLASASAIVAFLGVPEGRTATLIFVSLDVAWWFFLILLGMSASEGTDAIRLIGQLIFPPIWLAFVWWNFTRPDIGAYYKQESEKQQ